MGMRVWCSWMTPYLRHLALLVVVLEDRHSRFSVCSEALLDALLVVIFPATGLGALEKAFGHLFFRSGKEQYGLGLAYLLIA